MLSRCRISDEGNTFQPVPWGGALETSQVSGGGMNRKWTLVAALLLTLAAFSVAQDGPEQSETVCTFSDGRQLIARYNAVPNDRKTAPPAGKVWMPGGSAITLFTETPIKLAQTELKTGAYTMYLVPGKNDWTLIVSKNTSPQSQYDEKQDLGRSRMAVTSRPSSAKSMWTTAAPVPGWHLPKFRDTLCYCYSRDAFTGSPTLESVCASSGFWLFACKRRDGVLISNPYNFLQFLIFEQPKLA
ncbi:MAG: hypothetical protein DMG68_00725 [Acidobacteria bacterium]|nr:MAG: hypothetical protein DMG68_00725 [Acidobacteriota bacterium]